MREAEAANRVKEAKPKKVNIELIDCEERPDLYELKDELIAAHHDHLLTTRCRSCDAEIVWIRTTAGKQTPCDPQILAVVTDQGLVVRGRQSHFVSCPQAAKWRR